MSTVHKVRITTRNAGVEVPFFNGEVTLTDKQAVALQHLLSRTQAGTITADETAANERLLTMQAQGVIDETLAAQLPAFLDLVAAGDDVSSVTDAIDALLNP